MKSHLVLIFILAPVLLFSQSRDRFGNIFTEKVTHFTDSLGNEMLRIDNYIHDIDSLAVNDFRLNLLDIEEDKGGYFVLLYRDRWIRGQSELVLMKSYNYYYTPSLFYNAMSEPNCNPVRYFKVRGVAKINGVNVLVGCVVPKKFFTKVKTQKKVSIIMSSETIPKSEPFEDDVTYVEPDIIGIIDCYY